MHGHSNGVGSTRGLSDQDNRGDGLFASVAVRIHDL